MDNAIALLNLVICMAIAFWGLRLWNKSRARQLLAQGVRAKATVTKVGYPPYAQEINAIALYYEFMADGVPTVSAMQNLTLELSKLKVGDSFTVIYPIGNPRRNQPETLLQDIVSGRGIRLLSRWTNT